MRKKIIIIIILSILLIIDFGFSLRYQSNANKISILNEISESDLISDYAIIFFDLLKKGNYKEAYDKIEIKDFMEYDEFKNYISKNILANNSLISVFECKSNENIYDIIINIAPPLFSSDNLQKQAIYEDKNIKIKIKFNGVFDYKILEFKKVEE